MRLAREHLGICDVPPTDKQAAREQFRYLSVERGQIVACDGVVLAVVPVTLDADDVPGLVLASALKAALKAAGARDYQITVTLTAEYVLAPSGASFPRGGIGVTYPDWHRIVPRDVDSRSGQRPAEPVCFSPKLLDKLAKALGGTGIALWPNPVTSDGPMVVTTGRPGAKFDNGMPTAPFGALMPMMIEGAKAGIRRVA